MSVTYDQTDKQWVLSNDDGTEARFLTLTDLRDWLDWMENQRRLKNARR